jgi:ribosomal protein S27E
LTGTIRFSRLGFVVPAPTPNHLPDDYQLNVACPHCGAPIGKPLSVSTRKGDTASVDVRLKCTDCEHSWIVQKLTHDDPPA